MSPSRKLDREKDNGREPRTILRRKRLILCCSLPPILQELEKLEEQLAETKLEIEKYKGQGQSHDTARKKILLELEEKLNKTEEREAQYEVKYQRTMKAIGHIKQVVGSTFNKIGGQHVQLGTSSRLPAASSTKEVGSRRDATPEGRKCAHHFGQDYCFNAKVETYLNFHVLEFVFETAAGSSLELCKLAGKRFVGDHILII